MNEESNGSTGKKVWRPRDYFPNFDLPGLVQFISFHLIDVVPKETMNKWKLAFKETHISGHGGPKKDELWERIEEYADKGRGECWLKYSKIANMLQQTFYMKCKIIQESYTKTNYIYQFQCDRFVQKMYPYWSSIYLIWNQMKLG